jgi:hypothetical protein
MGRLSSHRRWRPSNGLNRTFTRARINLQDLCPEGLRIRSPMHLVSCPVPRTRRIRRASIPSPEASTATPSTQRRNHLFPEMAASHYNNRCHIMVLLITGLRITDRPISLIMPSLPRNNNTTTEWGTIWLDRVLTTLCRLIMHLLTWLIGP